MTRDELVELVARTEYDATCAYNSLPWAWETRPEKTREQWRIGARAALDALVAAGVLLPEDVEYHLAKLHVRNGHTYPHTDDSPLPPTHEQDVWTSPLREVAS